MALSRNRAVAGLLQLYVGLTRSSHRAFSRLLANDLKNHASPGSITPCHAWEIYKRSARFRSIADCGWLVQFGVYNFDRSIPKFHFSLVRQFNSIQTWTDELFQVELLLTTANPQMFQLLNSNGWEFNRNRLGAFFAYWESRSDFQSILAARSVTWSYSLDVTET